MGRLTIPLGLEAQRVLGTYEAVIDQAGRITIPLALRRHLGEDTILSYSLPPDRHLLVYERGAFDAYSKQMFPGGALTREQDEIMRITLGRSLPAKVDKAGRVLVPQRMRDWAGADGAVMVVGMGDHLEIWSAERYAAWELQLDSPEVAERIDQVRRARDEAQRAAPR